MQTVGKSVKLTETRFYSSELIGIDETLTDFVQRACRFFGKQHQSAVASTLRKVENCLFGVGNCLFGGGGTVRFFVTLPQISISLRIVEARFTMETYSL